ncbi:Similar to Uncharacterized transcriptional regulatory protein C3C7.04; acc. no. O14130 [Pyronema omphalodes CBS 100304]|uniref:Similar to Uncharacterized transcriptional regulatory protein C3C7.04 acc. no. O14130 n=1 Tax=Pyronema omphalodes (strain CBS 100304) TaxID=1076935 RepID=U4LNH4_PYROM|nr:Similar to Uncharacterized transcriptional regulatory protein C3C7.04; acc. no. O14130 [Pyronema omphalodes CBS 100304]
MSDPNPPNPRQPPPSKSRESSNGSGGASQAGGSNNGAGDVARVKRRKVATACDECRQRKSKCDGVKPSCGPCERKGRSPGRCTYQNDLTRTVSQSYIEELEARIRILEGGRADGAPTEPWKTPAPNGERQYFSPDYQRYETANRPLPPHHPPPQQGTDPATPNAISLPRIDHPSPMGPPALSPMDMSSTRQLPPTTPQMSVATPGYVTGPSNELPFQEETHTRRYSQSMPPPVPVQIKEGADAMGASTGDDEIEGENESFFGTSSTLSFMKQIKRTVVIKRTSSASPQDFHVRTPTGNVEGLPAKRRRKEDDDFLEDLEDFVLPPRSTADHLVECYWIWVHSLYPFLHRPTFMRTYQQLFDYSVTNGEGNPEARPPGRMFRCVLNLVFAFGCQFSPSIAPSRRDSSSDVFFKRSRLLLHVDILGSGSILLVQALLLMGQYLQSTKYPNRCWNVVGLAIRVAQGLGLHLDSTSVNRKNIVEREIWRRVWHGCILMDRIVSMTFGRPSMISLHSQVTLPLEVDDEHIQAESTICEQPEGRPSRISFFIQTLKLYDILGEILAYFYDSSGSKCSLSTNEKADDYYQSLLRLDRRLLDFQRELPPFLRLHPIDKNNCPYSHEYPFTTRQANVLHARYLNIRILLFRPILINLIQESPHAFPDQGFSKQPPITTTLLEASLALKCSVSCVLAAQEAISLIDDNLLTGAVPAWWYYIFYLYTAATVLLAAKLCPALEGELDYCSLEVSWKKCIEIMRGLEDRYESAKRCLATLEVFHDQIISSDEDQKPIHPPMQAADNGNDMQDGHEQVQAFDDPLLHFNRNAIWTTDVNLDWFMEHPLWNSPEVML